MRPFSVTEVSVRIDALLRRSRGTPTELTGPVLDPERFSVRSPGSQERLTPTEFRMLPPSPVGPR